MFIDFQQTGNPKLQHRINRSIIFHYLQEHGESTRSKIATALHLSVPTVSRTIDRLIQQQYVVEVGKQVTEVGKRPNVLSINRNLGFILCIDLVKEKLEMAAADFLGSVLATKTGFRIKDSRDICRKLVKELSIFVDEISSRQPVQLSPDKLLAIILGMPAEVDPNSGEPIGGSLYNNWYGIPFRKIISEDFGVPVYVERDVVLSIIAEKKLGNSKKYNHIIHVEVSTGVGVGIIMNNHLVRARGALGVAGDAAYTDSIIRSGADDANVRYDKYYGSIQSIVTKAIDRIQTGDKTKILELAHHDIESIDAHTVCQAALEGDQVAQQLILETVEILARGVSNIVLTLSPEVVVLGGELSTLPGAETLFREPIAVKMAKLVPFELPIVELSSLSEDAILLGGALVAVDNLIRDEFPFKKAKSA